jgi:hypothetical protein
MQWRCVCAWTRRTGLNRTVCAFVPLACSQSPFEVVEKLTDLGISATDVKKLKEAGYHTVESLFMRPKKVSAVGAMQTGVRTSERAASPAPCLHPQDLIAVKGLSEAKVDKILDSAAKVRS